MSIMDLIRATAEGSVVTAGRWAVSLMTSTSRIER
jgi:hypothetical protein